MSPLTTKAIRDVTRRKLRTTLTALGIAIGVMGLTAISMASGQFSSGLQALNDSSGQPDVQFFTAPTTAPVAADLSRQPNVRLADAQTVATGRWAVPTGHEPLAITGVRDFHDRPFQPFSLTAGAPPRPGEIVMESSDQSVTPLRVGDTISLQVGTSTHRLRVSGLVHTPGVASPTFTGQGAAYMRESDVRSLFNIDGTNAIQVRLVDYGQRTATARDLGQQLGSHDVVVLSSQVGRDVSGGGSSTVTGIFTVMQVLSVVALLLSVFLLLSTTMTLVAEQVPVIGTMKAIGARGRQVMRSYLTGVALYGALGTGVGVVLGIGLGDLLYRYFAVNLGMDPSAVQLGPSLFVAAVAVGIGMPLLAAALPVYLGTRITVKQALSGYGVSTGRRRQGGWAALVRAAFGFLPQSVQLGLRSLFRRRARAVLTVSALAISGAAFLAVQTTTSSWNAVLGDVFASYRADVFVTLDRPQPAPAVDALLTGVPGIAQTEPLSRTPVQTRWGSALLTGVATDPQLYRPHVVSGRWLAAGDRDVVLISEDAAQRSGLKVGDSIDFHTDLYSAHWRIVGIAKDLGNPAGAGTLLTTLESANAFYHLPPDYVQSVMVRSTSGSQADVNALARHIDDTLGGISAQATVTTAQQDVQRNQSTFLILYALFYSVVAIIALVGGIGLFNALAMGVLERRREIGILRSMGATGRRVAQVFWTEGVGLGVVAWAIAVAIGLPMAYGFVQLLGAVLLRSPFTLEPLSLLAMLAFIVVVASLATIGPVWSASRVRIAETLRYE
jgi:putative ABC transport system permease protein